MSIQNITANLNASHFKIVNDDVFVKTNGNPGILLIHATWCGHCKRFIPVYQSLCKKLNKKGNDFPCLAIESEDLNSDGGKLANALDVAGFPTLKFFDQHGRIVGEHSGSRDEKALLDQICKVYHHCVSHH